MIQQIKKQQHLDSGIRDLDKTMSKYDPMKGVLDFGNASKIGERKGEAPYKPIGTEKEK